MMKLTIHDRSTRACIIIIIIITTGVVGGISAVIVVIVVIIFPIRIKMVSLSQCHSNNY